MDNIDKEAAKALGIEVKNVAGYSTESVTEHFFMMLLSAMRSLKTYHANIREIKEENGSYIVTTYEDYTVHYTDNTPNSVNRKNKTYYLKPSGDSFVIYNLEVSEGWYYDNEIQ